MDNGKLMGWDEKGKWVRVEKVRLSKLSVMKSCAWRTARVHIVRQESES